MIFVCLLEFRKPFLYHESTFVFFFFVKLRWIPRYFNHPHHHLVEEGCWLTCFARAVPPTNGHSNKSHYKAVGNVSTTGQVKINEYDWLKGCDGDLILSLKPLHLLINNKRKGAPYG
ncbi:hypothetical protein TNCT_438571 [Trichonephila clavata]|uniref:Uncharacterized protein n=1 Tax=Trichonephila clavata TaxID=2740835 RepID=A0A8X6JFF5_TRICU|nr:hypothetical protein TNCT_438571 [Trichonephila clavata]